MEALVYQRNKLKVYSWREMGNPCIDSKNRFLHAVTVTMNYLELGLIGKELTLH